MFRDGFILSSNEKKKNDTKKPWCSYEEVSSQISRQSRGRSTAYASEKPIVNILVPAVCPWAALFRWCSCRGAVSVTKAVNNGNTWNYTGTVVKHGISFPHAWDSARTVTGKDLASHHIQWKPVLDIGEPGEADFSRMFTIAECFFPKLPWHSVPENECIWTNTPELLSTHLVWARVDCLSTVNTHCWLVSGRNSAPIYR